MSTATAVFEIPLQAATPQQLTVSLNGVQYKLTVRYNSPSGVWILDIADGTGNAIMQGIPMVTGADPLEQHAYLGIGGQLICQTDNDITAVPTFANLGQTSHLYFIPALTKNAALRPQPQGETQ
jgi:hypothetical protein